MPVIKEDPLQKYDASLFSFDRMKGEVTVAMKEDWKRDKIDDAKKRAIYDCRDYNEFKQRVAGCTLKPIAKNEFNAPPKFAFNRTVEGSTAVSGGLVASPPSISPLDRQGRGSNAGQGPKNSREVDRELRRRGSAEEKAALVVDYLSTGDDVYRVFGRELDAEVFRQLLEALEQAGTAAAVPPGTAQRFLEHVVERCPGSAAQAAAFFTAEGRGEGTSGPLARQGPGGCQHSRPYLCHPGSDSIQCRSGRQKPGRGQG
ncbi:unnamed protein product [Polarella glacialis]|uniref:Dynein attachment factor N-terminal domain-containing protein n=1 Tax=Polarella glacialis TaxID=89957 RepID=A0A813KNU5_POLGL|nr:unnamed protein product [Polarella glacialis]